MAPRKMCRRTMLLLIALRPALPTLLCCGTSASANMPKTQVRTRVGPCHRAHTQYGAGSITHDTFVWRRTTPAPFPMCIGYYCRVLSAFLNLVSSVPPFFSSQHNLVCPFLCHLLKAIPIGQVAPVHQTMGIYSLCFCVTLLLSTLRSATKWHGGR